MTKKNLILVGPIILGFILVAGLIFGIFTYQNNKIKEDYKTEITKLTGEITEFSARIDSEALKERKSLKNLINTYKKNAI